MSSPWISGLRSVALNVPDLAKAEAFYTEVWHLQVSARKDGSVYLRGSGSDHHLLALYAGGEVPQLRQVTLRARSREALDAIAAAVPAAGGTVLSPVGPLTKNPAGGEGLTLRDPHGRVFQVVWGDARVEAQPPHKDTPVRLAHVVLNSHAVDETRVFLEQTLGFRQSDRTRIMSFLNCGTDHHSLAVGITDNDALNHIAFLMPDTDGVMRGGGRMRDAGHPVQWGPGRHGPGNNVFNYFIDPFGVVIEYTSEVEQIDESYQAHGPEHWQWPPGRIDQWGVGVNPSPELKEAQRRVLFAPT